MCCVLRYVKGAHRTALSELLEKASGAVANPNAQLLFDTFLHTLDTAEL